MDGALFCVLFLAVFVEHLGFREVYEGVCSSHRSSWFVCFALAGDRAAAESHMLSRRLMLASALGSKSLAGIWSRHGWELIFCIWGETTIQTEQNLDKVGQCFCVGCVSRTNCFPRSIIDLLRSITATIFGNPQ